MTVNRRTPHHLLRHLIWAAPLLVTVAVGSCFRSVGLLVTRLDYVAGHDVQVSASFYSFVFFEGELIFGRLDHEWLPMNPSIPRTHNTHLQISRDESDGVHHRSGSRSWRIPLGALSVIPAMVPLFFWIRAAIVHDRLERERKARARGVCVKCGYDLRGTPHRCPECGASVTQSREES